MGYDLGDFNSSWMFSFYFYVSRFSFIEMAEIPIYTQ